MGDLAMVRALLDVDVVGKNTYKGGLYCCLQFGYSARTLLTCYSGVGLILMCGRSIALHCSHCVCEGRELEDVAGSWYMQRLRR